MVEKNSKFSMFYNISIKLFNKTMLNKCLLFIVTCLLLHVAILTWKAVEAAMGPEQTEWVKQLKAARLACLF